MRTASERVESWLDENEEFIASRTALIEIARRCSKDLGLKYATVEKLVRDILNIPHETSPLDYMEDVAKAYNECNVEEKLSKNLKQQDFDSIELDYTKNRKRDAEMSNCKSKVTTTAIGITGEVTGVSTPASEPLQAKPISKGNSVIVDIPETLVVTHVTCFGSVGKIDISPSGIYLQVPRYRDENTNDYVSVESIPYKTREDLQRHYDEISKCFEIKEALDLKTPISRKNK